jgi:hypothetical protein
VAFNLWHLSAACICFAEVVLFCLAGIIFFRKSGNTFAEAVVYACITTLMLFSFFFQVALLFATPFLSILFEVIFLVVAIRVIVLDHAFLNQTLSMVKSFWRGYPVGMSVFALGMTYLAALSLIIPPDFSSWKSLGQIVYFQTKGILPSAAASNPMLPFFSINHTALSHMFLRAHTDIGVNLFGLMAYVCIACSTYALARRYAWPPTALTVSLIVMGMPRLVYHAATPGTEIVPAAVALFGVLAVYRSVERVNIQDLLLLLLGIGFSISGGREGVIFPVLLIALSLILLIRRHGRVALWTLVVDNKWKVLVAMVPMLIFSQVWLGLINIKFSDAWMGSQVARDLSLNTDGLQGAIGNMLRYLLESFHMSLPVELFCRKVLGFSMLQLLQDIHSALPGFMGGVRGATEPFYVVWAPNSCYSWFGPFGFLLVFPALGYAILRGPRRLKALAVALAGYFYLVALIFAWSPGHARLLTVFFVCGGFSIAVLLPPWRLTRKGRGALQTVSAVLFFYALIFNTAKPLFPLNVRIDPGSCMPGRGSALQTEGSGGVVYSGSVWPKTRWGTDRRALAREYFGDGRVDQFAALVPARANVAFLTDDAAEIYPFAAVAPAIRAIPIKPADDGRIDPFRLEGFDFIFCTGSMPQSLTVEFEIMKTWDVQGGKDGNRSAFLLKARQHG